MKITKIALLAAASAAVLVPAATAQAQSQTYYRSVQECEAARQNRQVSGAIIGAILGGVIAAQIEDDIDDRDNRRHWRGRHHGYDGYYGRHRGYRGYDRGNENDVAVAAGAGLGGLIGYGLAGGQPCAPIYRNDQAGYQGGYDEGYRNGGYYDQRANTGGYYDDGYTYEQDPRYANNGGYANDPRYANNGYAGDQRYYGNGELAGGPDSYVYTQPSTEARVYTAGANNNCRWMETRRADNYGGVTSDSVWMCQGSDGIWRPAQ